MRTVIEFCFAAEVLRYIAQNQRKKRKNVYTMLSHFFVDTIFIFMEVLHITKILNKDAQPVIRVIGVSHTDSLQR